jgi:hydrogenase maturation protease
VPHAKVLESTRGGMELIDLLSGYERAIIVDCIVTDDPEPGKVHELTLEHVEGSARLLNAHELSVGDAFRLAAGLGIPMPGEVRIFGVEGSDIATLTETMTPLVEAAVAPLARRIVEILTL